MNRNELAVFGAEEVRALLDYPSCIAVVREAMMALSRGETRQLLRTMIHMGEGRTFAQMPGALSDNGMFGAKMISVFASPENPGVRRHRGLVTLFEPEEGRPVCVADAEEITHIRTAAATAVATAALARDDAEVLLLMGTGGQVHSHLEAMPLVRDFRRILIWGGDAGRIAAVVDRWRGRLPVEAAPHADLAVGEADVICTLTGARAPILLGEWVKPGTHVNAVGSSGPGPVEVDNALVLASRYVADSRASALDAAAEFLVARAAGLVTDAHVVAEIGEVLLGRVAGRESADQITLYKSLGHAVQDLAAAAHIHAKSVCAKSGMLMIKTLRLLACSTLALSALTLSAGALHAEAERFAVIDNGENVGHVYADVEGNHVTIDHDVKSNGRGPTMREDIVLGAGGLPSRWTLTGTSTFGNAVDERMAASGGTLSWTDTTGKGTLKAKAPTLYVSQQGSPFSLGIYAAPCWPRPATRFPPRPGGRLSLEEEAPVTLGGMAYRAYLVKGIGLTPSAVLLDDGGRLVATYSPTSATVREDLASFAGQLGQIAATRSAERFAAIQKKVAHRYDAPIRIRNVRLFDPASGKLGDPVSIVVFEDRISAIEPLDSPPGPREVAVDGAGRVVIPGLHDMHAHLSLQSALLYIASGVTSVRDMGNDNAFLIDLNRRIEAGEVAGPRVVRNGFLEGRSPYSSRNGFIVDSEAEALDAVRWYGAHGYWQIKIYNSFHPEWVPAVAAEAKRLGMGVTGHIPAFTDADAMIAAGYDEVTHINQLMLGWVLEPGEDTRTPLRLTAMRRTAGLDLSSPRVVHTLDTMQNRHIALDPTAVTLELLMLSRDGRIAPAVAGYFDHLPVGVQRNRRQGIAPIAGPADAAAYDGAFATIGKLLLDMYRRGITLLPGTDDQTGLSVHRELQIYHEAGIPAADVLRIGTLGAERYLGRDQMLGSVEKGKFADFVLLDGNPLEDMSALHRMAMVVKGGTVYFPGEIWNEVGVKPFAAAPDVTVPAPAPKPVALISGDHVHEDFAF